MKAYEIEYNSWGRCIVVAKSFEGAERTFREIHPKLEDWIIKNIKLLNDVIGIEK